MHIHAHIRGSCRPIAARATALVDAYKAIAAKTAASRSNASLQDARFKALSDEIQTWRADVQGSTEQVATDEQLLSPADSAGFYWAKLNMANYADAEHVVERCPVATNLGAKVYYRSPAFWRASAAVNLPNAVGHLYSHALNGFDSRCCAYGVAMVVLTDDRLPDARGVKSVSYPEGYTPSRT